MIGEVWIAAGQSNMRFPLKGATNGKEDAAKANHPPPSNLHVGRQMADVQPDRRPPRFGRGVSFRRRAAPGKRQGARRHHGQLGQRRGRAEFREPRRLQEATRRWPRWCSATPKRRVPNGTPRRAADPLRHSRRPLVSRGRQSRLSRDLSSALARVDRGLAKTLGARTICRSWSCSFPTIKSARPSRGKARMRLAKPSSRRSRQRRTPCRR